VGVKNLEWETTDVLDKILPREEMVRIGPRGKKKTRALGGVRVNNCSGIALVHAALVPHRKQFTVMGKKARVNPQARAVTAARHEHSSDDRRRT